MILDLTELNPAVKFQFGDDAFVWLRTCAGDDWRKIEKQTTTKRVEYKVGQRFEIIDEDKEARNAMLWDFCIVNWEGLIDKNGNDISCTKENKIMLMDKSILFAQFVSNSLETLRNDNEAREAELRKNAKGS